MVVDSVQTEIPRITPSSVGDLDCPKKYYTLRIAKQWPTREPVENVAHGIAVHQVLRELYQRRLNGEINLKHLEPLARAAVSRGRYPNDSDPTSAQRRVIEAVRAFVKADDYEDIEGTIALERQIEFQYIHNKIPLYLVGATLDRVLVREGEPTHLVVRDYKTTCQKVDLQESLIILWSAKQAYPQYTKYSLEYDWLTDENQINRSIVSGQQVRGLHRIITDSAINILNATEYPAIPGPVCTYCPLRSECQRLDSVELDEGEEIF